MKKILLIISFIMLIPSIASAESGTCSWHGGVNCSAMADWDGSTICNDGWRDSSEQYYQMKECEASRHYCTQAESSQLDLKYGVAEKTQIMNDIYARMTPYTQRALLPTTDMQTLRSDAIEVQNLRAQYDIAQADAQNAINQSQRDCFALGDIEYQRAKLESLKNIAESFSQNQTTQKYTCPENSTLNSANACICNSGYANYRQQCINMSDYCLVTYGLHSIPKLSTCSCENGYLWSTSKSLCIKIESTISQPTVSENKPMTNIDKKLTDKLKGKILLQVESKGEAWYVSPVNGKRLYMANGNEAYKIMRSEGKGISNKDLEAIKKDKKIAKRNSGKIFLQVQDKGQAYYIDFNGNAIYLKNGDKAFELMRSAGAGISNKDLEKINF